MIGEDGVGKKFILEKAKLIKFHPVNNLNRLANKAIRVTLTKSTYDTMTLKAQTALYTIGSPMRAL